MERHIITLDERGTLHVPEAPGTSIWMDEPELVELFGVIAPTLRAAVKAVYKSGIVTPHETERRISLPDGNRQVVYSLSPDSRPRFPPSIPTGPGDCGEYVTGRFGDDGKGGKGMQLLIMPDIRHTGYA